MNKSVEVILYIVSISSLAFGFYEYFKSKPKDIDYTVCIYNDIPGCYEKCCGKCDNQECQIRCSANYKKCGGHTEVEK